jgi:predicted dienelactone hydrolase
MNLRRVLPLLCVALIGFIQPSRAGDTNALYKAAPGPYTVETARYNWQDSKRNRDVPVKIYYPTNAEGPLPIIIFSHGLGGSREGYGYLGKHWASCGYVVVHLQHIGSDSSVWEDVPPAERMEAMRKSVLNLQNAVNRPLDVTFAIDQIVQMNSTGPILKHRLDLDRIGVAGHSFGAFTTLAVVGEVFVTPSGEMRTHTDPRVKAAIAMSSPVPQNKSEYDTAFSKIKIPVFHMTGTLDTSPIGETKAEDRRVPFDHTCKADQYLLTFNGGDHMVFSGRLLSQNRNEKDDLFHTYILSASTAFWDAYLKGDAKAKEFLSGSGFETALGGTGKFEKKLLDSSR